MKTNTPGAKSNCCDEKVVNVAGDKLTSTCDKGNEHHYKVAKDVKVTCDGESGKLSDVKKGSTIRMTTCKDDTNKILAIDCGKHIPEIVTR